MLLSVFLTVASIQDVLKRQVEDIVWLTALITGFIINLILTVNPFSWLFSILSGLILAFLSFKIKFLSGADCKAIITISSVYPFNENIILPYVRLLPAVFEIYFFFLLLTSLIPFSILFYNIVKGNHKNLLTTPHSIKLKLLTTCIGILDSENRCLEALNSLDDFYSENRCEHPKKYRLVIKKDNNMRWVYYKFPLLPLLLFTVFLKMVAQAVIINV